MWTSLVPTSSEENNLSCLPIAWSPSGGPWTSNDPGFLNRWIPDFCVSLRRCNGQGDMPPDPGIPPGQIKTACRAATLHGGPIDSLAAYRLKFYCSSQTYASAICAGGAA